MNYLANLAYFVPELLACLTMLAVILIEAFHERNRGLAYLTGFLGLLATLVALVQNLNEEVTIFTGSLTIDRLATLAKMVMVVGTGAAVYLARESRDIYPDLKGEFVSMALGILVGGMLLASANNMLTLYLGVETLSILSYVMAAFKKRDGPSSEAGLKYALYGGVSAGMMLFGMSHLYGALGSLSFSAMASNLDQAPLAVLLPSFLLFFVGIGYKISVVPFHMWSPDVYEGSPLPVTAFFAVVPKVAGMAALLRITHTFFQAGELSVRWVEALGVVAVLTMSVGNVAAIGQRSIKRMLAYSSIAHAGVILLGVLVVDQTGVQAVLYYTLVYLFMTVTAFGVVSFVQDTCGNDRFESFSGMIHRHPLMAVVTTLVMLSLAGVPPLSGFVAKFYLFSLVIKKQYYALALVAGVNSVVSLYYYLKIVRVMIFDPAKSGDRIEGFGFVNQSLIVALAVPVVLLGLLWAPVMDFIGGTKIFLAGS